MKRIKWINKRSITAEFGGLTILQVGNPWVTERGRISVDPIKLYQTPNFHIYLNDMHLTFN